MLKKKKKLGSPCTVGGSARDLDNLIDGEVKKAREINAYQN